MNDMGIDLYQIKGFFFFFGWEIKGVFGILVGITIKIVIFITENKLYCNGIIKHIYKFGYN